MKNDKKRIYIICNCNFPRGGAVSNYVQFLMLAIKEAGFDVKLISNINDEFIKSNSKEEIAFRSFKILPIKISNNRIIKHVQYKEGFAKQRIRILNKEKISENDVLFVLGSNPYFYEKILKLKKKNNFKVMVGVLELFEEKDLLGKNKADSRRKYKEYKYTIDKLIPKFDCIVPISTFIGKYYEHVSKKTMILPIMADVHEFPVTKKTCDNYKFIIPANGMMKDALPSMLKSILLILENDNKNIEIHLCGIKQNLVEDIIGKEKLSTYSKNIIIHKWMKYTELIDLYQKMNFILLEREVSQMTLANFPSKIPETMTFGIVPIVTDVGDYTKYYLNDNINSIFINGTDKDACYKALQKAIALSPEQYMEYSNNARKCVEKKFDYRVWVKEIAETIQSL